ncbi:MAG: hypothetical protein ABIO65_04725 [Nitrospiria bacterium]
MPKLSEEARKKIADGVKKSWAARRARQAAKPAANGAAQTAKAAKPSRRKLSAAARQRIADALKASWAMRRAGGAPVRQAKIGQGGGAVMAAIEQASQTLRTLTLADIRPLSGRRDAATKLEELASLASELKRLIHQ